MTRKQIEKEFPNFKVRHLGGRKGYEITFIPWNVDTACVLRGLKIDGIYRVVKDCSEEYDRTGTIDRSYFRNPVDEARREKEYEEYHKQNK